MIHITLNELLIEKQYKGSLRTLAIEIGESRERIRRFAANEMQNVPLDLVNKICIYFDCNINDVLKLEKEKEESD